METVKNAIYSYLRFFKDNFRFLREFISIPRSVSNQDYKCHMLLVRDRKYLSVAKYSISSFLKFNPKFRIILHVDDKLHLRARVLKLFLGGALEVIKDQSNSLDPLDAKAQLIIKLQGTNDIFFDADTRWNGSLKLTRSITVMTAEFDVQSQELWPRILSALNLEGVNFYMLNTTFFSWSGNDLGINFGEYLTWNKLWNRIDWEGLRIGDMEKSFNRLCEQLFISYILREKSVTALKSEDKVSDGGIVESSYLGATGHRFAR